jgi:ubiquinone/menaquinone biosynthesis C-methylase UbiE
LDNTLAKGGSILDIGCGTGRHLTIFKPYFKNVVGLDISKNMIKSARKKGHEPLVGDAENLPFRNNSFDVIISIGVLEHIGDYIHGLQEMKRVARREVYAINLNHLCPLNKINYALNKEGRKKIMAKPDLLTPYKMTKIFKKCGFKNVRYKVIPGFSPRSPLFFLNSVLENIPVLKNFGAILIVRGSLDNL